jgi:hypothetical protein
MHCKTLTTAFWLAAACSTAAFAQDRKDYRPCEAYQSIGAAHMDADGAITLYIHTLPPGPIGEDELHYAPDDPRLPGDRHTPRRHQGWRDKERPALVLKQEARAK